MSLATCNYIFLSLQKEYSWEYVLRILMGQLFLVKAPNCVWLLEWQMNRAQCPTTSLVHFAFSRLLLWVEGSHAEEDIDTGRRQRQWESVLASKALHPYSSVYSTHYGAPKLLVWLLFDWRLAPWFWEELALVPSKIAPPDSPQSPPQTPAPSWLKARPSAEGQSACAMEKMILTDSFFSKWNWSLNSWWPDTLTSTYGLYSGTFQVLNQQTVLAIEQAEDQEDKLKPNSLCTVPWKLKSSHL